MEAIAPVRDLAQEPLVSWSAGLVVVGQRIDVLQDEGTGLGLG